MGTAHYVSPEMLKDNLATQGSDFWALGVILYQMLTGELPFKGQNDYAIFLQIMNGGVPAVQDNEDISEDAADLIVKML